MKGDGGAVRASQVLAATALRCRASRLERWANQELIPRLSYSLQWIVSPAPERGVANCEYPSDSALTAPRRNSISLISTPTGTHLFFLILISLANGPIHGPFRPPTRSAASSHSSLVCYTKGPKTRLAISLGTFMSRTRPAWVCRDVARKVTASVMRMRAVFSRVLPRVPPQKRECWRTLRIAVSLRSEEHTSELQSLRH